jgi:TRAP-type transport system small permease protein
MSLLPPRPPSIAPVRVLAIATDWSIVVIGAVMIMLVFFNVVAHLFGKDFAWTIELCELLMVWVTFLGGAAAAHRGSHMSITEFLDKLGPAARRAADAAIQLSCGVMLVLLVRYGWGLTQSSWDNILTVLNVPMAVQYLALPVGSLLMLVFVMFDFWQTLRGVPREVRYSET